MPFVTPPAANPYPLVQDVLDLARARVNDAAISIDGNLLSNIQPYTNTYLQAAWRWLETKCAMAGVETFIQSTVLFGLPQAAVQDTAVEAYVTWLGCSDGVNQFETPALPSDLILPLKVEIRQNGTNNVFAPMRQAEDGLPRYLERDIYDWRADGMYFYGWQFATDMKLRYSAYRAPLNMADPAAMCPIMFCQDSLSARIAYEFANARGAAQAPAMAQAAEDAFDMIAQGTARKNQRRNIRRKPFARRHSGRNSYPQVF